jgi:hypothetical protein
VATVLDVCGDIRRKWRKLFEKDVGTEDARHANDLRSVAPASKGEPLILAVLV